MSTQCQACGHPFTPRPQNPNQKYCTNSECQRERRRRWQQQARQGDSDCRDNDIRSRKTWAAENPEYWKRYRDGNPAYVERNRNLQQQRNQKQRTTVIANEDVCVGNAVDTLHLTRVARWALKRIYRPGFAYQKAGVALLNLRDAGTVQMNLFSKAKDHRGLMQVMDRINGIWGRGTLHSAAEGVHKEWTMKRELKSPGYTTRWDQLPIAT